MVEFSAAKDGEIQRHYYVQTAHKYGALHMSARDEHSFALCMLVGALDLLEVGSLLDVGSGTGRVLDHVKQHRPDLVVRGIEPVRELREVAYVRGITPAELCDGNALALPYADGEFDMVCEFGVLHHLRTPACAVDEMLRVARKAIFISDSNNFGQGSFLSRSTKQCLDLLGLWPLANWIKTRGRGYTLSEGDGLSYSYSVFNNYAQIQKKCHSVHIFNTSAGAINSYRSAGHVALLGIKR